jgi:predicted dehydrogenase
MNEQKLKFGMISTANIERWALIAAIRKARNCELVAVSSRTEEKARSFAAQYEIPRSYGSYEALLMSNDVDAVYVPVPNSLHREWAIKAAEDGKHLPRLKSDKFSLTARSGWRIAHGCRQLLC